MLLLRFLSPKAAPANPIWWITGCYLAVGLCLWFIWIATQQEVWIRFFFDHAGALFFVGMAGVEFCLGVLCYRQFSAGEPLRRAWLLISIGSACRLIGMVTAHILGAQSFLNPYLWHRPSAGDAVASFRRMGLAMSGPIHMMLLAAGLFQVLLVYRRVGLAARLRGVDWILLAVVVSFTCGQGYEVLVSRSSSRPLTVYAVLNWMTDPLLSFLLMEAILIRRYVLHMGRGLIAQCWGAYTKAIFATSLGSIGMWAMNYQHIPLPLSSLTWYVWFVVSAAFAVGPAFQLQAIRRANERAHLDQPPVAHLGSKATAHTRAI